MIINTSDRMILVSSTVQFKHFLLGHTWELLEVRGWGVRALGVVGHCGGLGRLQVGRGQVELRQQEAQEQHELQGEGVQEELDAEVWGWTWGICA